MTGDTNIEPRRQVWHFALLVGFMFIMVTSQLLGQRPLLYGLFNNVAPAGAAPADVIPDPGEEWATIIHRSDWRQPIAGALGHFSGKPARLGWVVREFSVLSMPVAGWRISDVAVMTENPYGYNLIGLTDGQAAALAARGAVGWFPWWRLVWGLVPLAMLAGFAWGEMRWQARRRALSGML